MNKYPELNKVYKHYKGGVYMVLFLAPHTETGETLVIYKSLLFGSYHARPLSMWFEEVEVGDYKGPRFVKNSVL